VTVIYVLLRVQPISQERATVQVPGELHHEVPLVHEETDSEELVHAQEIVDAAVAEIKSLVTLSDVTVTGRVVVDDKVDDGILRVADETRTDIIVMGTRGLSALRGAIMGSVSHALIEKASCPVLIVIRSLILRDRGKKSEAVNPKKTPTYRSDKTFRSIVGAHPCGRPARMVVEYKEQVKRLVLDEQVFVRFTMKGRYLDLKTYWGVTQYLETLLGERFR